MVVWDKVRVGGLLLLAFLALSPAAIAQRGPTNEDLANQGYVADYGHPAGWYFAQHKKLSATLAALKPQRPGVVDAYVISIGLDADAVFGREAAEASRVLARRFDAEGRTVLLAAGGGAANPAVPHGSPQNLAIAIGAVAAVMDPKEDVLIFYSTSHGDAKIGLAYRDGDAANGMISPKRLKELLDTAGISRRVIILSACYSGVFVPVLGTDDSVIITAASPITTSFGCAATNDWTFFGDALINNGLRDPVPLAGGVDKAFALIAQWELMRGLPASAPQVRIGTKASEWLLPLEARMPKETTAKVGRPAIGG
jgi:hypothetical protein